MKGDVQTDVHFALDAQTVTTERGSAMALFVAAFVAVFMLVGICVDAATVFLGHRELANATNAAANDAVSGIDLDAYYAGGGYTIADSLARILAERSQAFTTSSDVENVEFDAPVRLSDTSVRVSARGEVHLFFSKAFPFVSSTIRVHASSVADAQGATPP